MKFLLSLILAASTVLAFAGTDGWQVDYNKALTQARAQNKQVLLDFTGSDWCGWCIRLKKEAFDQPAFTNFAKGKLILVEVDFPRAKPQSDVVKKQNASLQKDYHVEGFPTLVLLDSNGKQLRKHVGYLEGGADGLIRWISQEK